MSRPDAPDARPARYVRCDVLWRRVADGLVVLPPAGHEVIDLRGSALAVWELFCTPLTLSEGAHRLSTEYATSIETVLPDLERAVKDLVHRGAIREVQEP